MPKVMERNRQETNAKPIFRRKWMVMIMTCVMLSPCWTPSPYPGRSRHTAKAARCDTNVVHQREAEIPWLLSVSTGNESLLLRG